MSGKGEGKTVSLVEILKDAVELSSNDETGAYIQFDRTPPRVNK